MGDFRRDYRLHERRFPRSGVGEQFMGPGQVSELVQPVWPALDLYPGQFNWVSRINTTAGAGTVNLLLNEPPRGRIWLPVRFAIEHNDGVVSRQFTVFIGDVTTPTNPADDWGWWMQDFGIASGITVAIWGGAVVGGTPSHVLPKPPPVMHGTRIQVQGQALAAATTVNAHVLYLDIPGELAKLDDWGQ